MKFLEILKKRYSVRNYLNRSIENEKLEFFLECAKLSQSESNFQPWVLNVVKDGVPTKKRKSLNEIIRVV